jgi:hypothetical protein
MYCCRLAFWISFSQKRFSMTRWGASWQDLFTKTSPFRCLSYICGKSQAYSSSLVRPFDVFWPTILITDQRHPRWHCSFPYYGSASGSDHRFITNTSMPIKNLFYLNCQDWIKIKVIKQDPWPLVLQTVNVYNWGKTGAREMAVGFCIFTVHTNNIDVFPCTYMYVGMCAAENLVLYFWSAWNRWTLTTQRWTPLTNAETQQKETRQYLLLIAS